MDFFINLLPLMKVCVQNTSACVQRSWANDNDMCTCCLLCDHAWKYRCQILNISIILQLPKMYTCIDHFWMFLYSCCPSSLLVTGVFSGDERKRILKQFFFIINKHYKLVQYYFFWMSAKFKCQNNSERFYSKLKF